MSKIKVFYSYSHKDKSYLDELLKFTTHLVSKGLIVEWVDKKLLAGDNFDEKIDSNLSTTDIFICLLSQNYLSSQACLDEFNKARISNNITTIPIILNFCSWKDFCKDIISIPADGKPIEAWENKQEAWMNVLENIQSIIVERSSLSIRHDFVNIVQRVEFVSKVKDIVMLPDLFVWPEFKKLDYDNELDEKIEGNDNLFFSDQEKSTIITGPELSGKSTIAKKIFLESINKGKYPILFDGNSIHKTVNFDDIAKEYFNKQYKGDYDDFQKIRGKIAIIDNYSELIARNILAWLEEKFEKVYIFVQDSSYQVYFKDDKNFAGFFVYSIMSSSYVKQHELIQKWCKINDGSLEGEDFDIKVDRLELKINDVITKNKIVPRFPYYILSILQAFDGFLGNDYQVTSYGHCYHSLIISQFYKKGILMNEFDTAINFLTQLAYFLFKLDKMGTCTKQEYQLFKNDYKFKYIIENSLISIIEKSDYPIITEKNDNVKFEYSYLYYFFAGRFMGANNRLDEIAQLCEKVHLKDSAYILIFTIHHTTSVKMLEEIQLHCMDNFDTNEPVKLLTQDTSFINDVIKKFPETILNEKTSEENRKKERKIKDKVLHKSEQNNSEEDKIQDVELIKINKTLRIIEVLGQIIKNRAGTFEKEKIEEILLELENSGLRLLNFFLNVFKSPEMLEWLVEKIKQLIADQENKKKSMTDEELRRVIKKIIQFQSLNVIMFILGKIFHSVNSEKILEVQENICKKYPFPSYEILDILLRSSNGGVDTDYARVLYDKYIEDDNLWAAKTLSHILQNYLNTHNVNFKKRQQIYSMLGINKYIPNRAQ